MWKTLELHPRSQSDCDYTTSFHCWHKSCSMQIKFHYIPRFSSHLLRSDNRFGLPLLLVALHLATSTLIYKLSKQHGSFRHCKWATKKPNCLHFDCRCITQRNYQLCQSLLNHDDKHICNALATSESKCFFLVFTLFCPLLYTGPKGHISLNWSHDQP